MAKFDKKEEGQKHQKWATPESLHPLVGILPVWPDEFVKKLPKMYPSPFLPK
jgi:hypothetical protein